MEGTGKTTPRIDIPIEELVKALGNKAEAEQLMKRYGVSKADLLQHAERVTQQLSNAISDITRV